MKFARLKSFPRAARQTIQWMDTAFPPSGHGWDRLALGLCLYNLISWFAILSLKYFHFDYYDWDLALYAHAMWNLAHGSLTSTLWGTSFLSNHAEYIAFLLTPLYALMPHPLTLIFLKVLALSAGGWVFYLIAKNVIDRRLAVFLVLVYFSYPPNAYMLLYEFHFENLAVPFLFLLFYFFQRQRLGLFVITAVVTALIKENLALVVAGYGVFALLTKRPRKLFWVFVPLVIGLGIFSVGVFWMIPHLRAEQHVADANAYLKYYLPLTNAALPWSEKIAQNLRHLAGNLALVENGDYLTNLAGPFLFLPLLSPGVLFLGLPLFLQHLLSDSFQMKTMYYHYAASVVPFIFLSVVYTFEKIKNFSRGQTFRLLVLILSLGSLINLQNFFSNENPRVPVRQENTHLFACRSKILNQIPKDAAVGATFDFLPRLTNRKRLYTFYKLWRQEGIFAPLSDSTFPSEVSYAVLDWNDGWLWYYSLLHNRTLPARRAMFHRMKNIFLEQPWSVVTAAENLVLLKKETGGNPDKLVAVSPHAFPRPGSLRLNTAVGGHFILEGIGSGAMLPDGRLPLTFYWKALKGIDTLYSLTIDLSSSAGKIFSRLHYIGYGICPTLLWKKGEHVQENYWLLLPDLPAGEYGLTLKFHDYLKDRKENKPFFPAASKPLKEVRLILKIS